MPIIRRVPKRGFNNGAFRKNYATLNVESLEAHFESGATVDEAALRAAGLVKGRHDDGLKILGDGALTKALTVHAVKFTASAAEKIAAAGGKAIVVEPPQRTAREKSPEEQERSKRAKVRGKRSKSLRAASSSQPGA